MDRAVRPPLQLAVTERTKAAIAAVEGKIGYRFTDASLLNRALTHASAGTGAASTYERLEFLGDRVLGFFAIFQAPARGSWRAASRLWCETRAAPPWR
jgi:hypothetical protein